jgi:alpha 1,3-glucosidase
LPQAAAFQPFFRVHSHIETARREPYLFSQETVARLKAAVLLRYSFMPYWYTLFYEYEKSGVPPMRPIWMEFPCDSNTLKMDDEHMLGSDERLDTPVCSVDYRCEDREKVNELRDDIGAI